MPTGTFERTETHCKNISLTLKSKGYLKGKPSLFKGRKHSEESKLKSRISHLGQKLPDEQKLKIAKTVKLSWDKRGRHGKFRGLYFHVRDAKYKNWRLSVFERDGYTCQDCRITGIYLEAHHIKSWSKYPELRYKVSNGLTLCLDCHKKTDNYKNRKGVNHG